MNGHHNSSSVASNVMTRKPENIGVFTDPQHNLYTKTSPIPTPGPGECLVHVRATGICGSDIHFWVRSRAPRNVGAMKHVLMPTHRSMDVLVIWW
jgi:hypothetical protein